MSRRPDLPVLTVDMDGVFCSPYFGWNVGVHRTFLDPGATPVPARITPRWLGEPLDHLRFNPRRPLPGAREALERLREVRQLVVLTGRRTYPRWWLRRHGFEALFDRVVVNQTRLRSPHFKLDALTILRAAEHIDDDPRTAQLLAQGSDTRIFLRDWPTNRVDLDPRVQRVRDLGEFADRLGAPPAAGGR
ncbi:MAG: hypothetical protein M0R73_04035 [Dehalococcoidia bacterium]|nr:hypothetical protein [Dehalococcoidia bacterium]